MTGKGQNRRAPNNMGSIYQRKDGRFEGKVSLPNGKRKSVYAETERECVALMQELLNNQRLGLPVHSDERLTVAQYLNLWLLTKKVRPATRKQYEVSIRIHLLPGLGHYRLTKLAPQHLREWMASKESSTSPSTLRLAVATLKSALSQAVADELIIRNPAKLVKAPAAVDYEANFLTVEQARHFLACVKGHKLEALYAVALSVGLRRGEALALSWPDVDFEGGKLHVRHTLQRIDGKLLRTEPKTKGSKRTIILPSGLIAALRAHRTRQLEERLHAGSEWIGNQWDLVFVSERGTPLEPRNLNRQMAGLLRRAGLGHIRLHDCRHTACALLLSQGIQIHVVSKILGHANPSITLKVYSKVLPTQQDEAALAMNNLLFG